jgi:hypothetical protein
MTSSLQSAISEQQWMAKHAVLGDSAIALFSFLLSVANGRTTFTMTVDEMRKLTTPITQDRFLSLVRRLEYEQLIECRVSRRWRTLEQAVPDVWIIRDDPGWRVPKLRVGEKFNIPNYSPRNGAQGNDRERALFERARTDCVRRGEECPFPDFESFFRALGERPPGTRLCRNGDGYEWRGPGKREVAQ